MEADIPMQVPVTAKCKKCGGENLTTPENPTDESIIVCADCGQELGTFGELRKAALATVLEEYEKAQWDSLADTFKNVDGVEFK